jgi:hypothetical protein
MNSYNDTANYNNRAFDFGFWSSAAPKIAVFGAIEDEKVLKTEYPYNGTYIDTIKKNFDPIDFAIIEEIGRSKYLTSLHIYQFVRLRGLAVSRGGVRNRINKMLKLRLLIEYTLRPENLVHGIKAYGLDTKGKKIALDCKVLFNRGNMVLSEHQKEHFGRYDTAEDIKRILVGNMIVLGLLMNGANLRRFGIMETMRVDQALPITNKCIIRTASNVQLGDESHLLYEVVRNTQASMESLANKVDRYYQVVSSRQYKENNYYGYTSVPQLILCGENYEHNLKIDKYLRDTGLYSEEDTLLYTEDLLYVQATLKNLYVLDENGNRAWYSIPAK